MRALTDAQLRTMTAVANLESPTAREVVAWEREHLGNRAPTYDETHIRLTGLKERGLVEVVRVGPWWVRTCALTDAGWAALKDALRAKEATTP